MCCVSHSLEPCFGSGGLVHHSVAVVESTGDTAVVQQLSVPHEQLPCLFRHLSVVVKLGCENDCRWHFLDHAVVSLVRENLLRIADEVALVVFGADLDASGHVDLHGVFDLGLVHLFFVETPSLRTHQQLVFYRKVRGVGSHMLCHTHGDPRSRIIAHDSYMLCVDGLILGVGGVHQPPQGGKAIYHAIFWISEFFVLQSIVHGKDRHLTLARIPRNNLFIIDARTCKSVPSVKIDQTLLHMFFPFNPVKMPVDFFCVRVILTPTNFNSLNVDFL